MSLIITIISIIIIIISVVVVGGDIRFGCCVCSSLARSIQVFVATYCDDAVACGGVVCLHLLGQLAANNASVRPELLVVVVLLLLLSIRAGGVYGVAIMASGSGIQFYACVAKRSRLLAVHLLDANRCVLRQAGA